MESSINAIALASLDGRITYVNPAFAQLWGYAAPADALGRNVLEFWEQPDEAQRVIDALAEQGRWFGALSARCTDGASRLLQVSGHLVHDESGAPHCMMASFVDVSQRAAAERELARLNATLEERVEARTRELAAERNFIATVLDTVGALVVVLDREGRIVEFNPACEKLTGYALEEMRGAVLWERLIPPEQVEDVRREFAVLASTGMPSHHENDWLTRDGARRWIVWSNASIVRNDGRVEHVIGTGIDITERKAAERAMLEAKNSAERANAEKSAFLSRMSHELRTPLHAILGFAQLMVLEAKRLSNRQRETLKSIQGAGWHLLSLIDDVLDLSKIESGSEPVRLEPVDVAKVVQECVGMTASAAQGASVSIVVEPSAQRRRHVMADATRLRQVLANLLSNAVKYNRARGIVRIRLLDAEERRAALQIEDSGIGMDETQLGRLFEPFNRLGAESLGIEGTGIGLVICKRLVEAMGGTIGVESRSGKGSTFTVTLHAAEAVARVPARPRSAPRVRSRSARGGRTVLYVEDDGANAEVMRRVFARRRDLRLVLAKNGSEALELARRHRPELMILDMNLPAMDGLELLARLRELEGTRAVPAIALSANAYGADVARAKSAGFADYLTKPLRVEEFLARLDEILQPGPARPG
jgi:PAS domain S-box-containing protein